MTDASPASPAGQDEVLVALDKLIGQAKDDSAAVLDRIHAIIAARTYLEALTLRLVGEACEGGSTWEEIGLLFGTSAANAKARFGNYRTYDDED